jgi:hypothetical protein
VHAVLDQLRVRGAVLVPGALDQVHQMPPR